MKKKFTALIVVMTVLALIGFTATAFAQAPSISSTGKAIAALQTSDEGMQKKTIEDAVIIGQASVAPTSWNALATMAGEVTGKNAIDTARAEVKADQKALTTKKENTASETTPTFTLATEHVPKYFMVRTDGTAVEAKYIVTKSLMDTGGTGGVALQWQNGGGPLAGTAEIVGSEMAARIDKKTAGALVTV